MEFGDLEDKVIQTKLVNVQNSINKIEQILDVILQSNIYEKCNTKSKVDFDLFVAYTLNTLCWIYLRTTGLDPNKTDVKNELNRIREYMLKAKQAHERNTIRPRLQQDVAKRFIKHGINQSTHASEGPPNKKIKFADD